MSNHYELIDSAWLTKNIDLFLKKRVVIVTGAGISVSSGIPDFRSKQGLFNSIKDKHKVNGKDLFQHRFGHEKETRPIYYKFISELKELTEEATPSLTHSFLHKLKKYNKKYRIYTQNIDSLEVKAGIQSENLIYLHGNLNYLICTMCGHKIDYTDKVNEIYKRGEDIECTSCIIGNRKRKESKIRPTKVGFYHTNIIHYDQPHYDAYKIARLFESDMDLDLFIVMGTSLKVYGVKEMVKRGLRKVRLNNGKGVLVNLEEPCREFREMFDYFWKGECDAFSKEVLNNIEILKVDQRLSILNVRNEDKSLIITKDKKVDKEAKNQKKKIEVAKKDSQNTETRGSYLGIESKPICNDKATSEAIGKHHDSIKSKRNEKTASIDKKHSESNAKTASAVKLLITERIDCGSIQNILTEEKCINKHLNPDNFEGEEKKLKDLIRNKIIMVNIDKITSDIAKKQITDNLEKIENNTNGDTSQSQEKVILVPRKKAGKGKKNKKK